MQASLHMKYAMVIDDNKCTDSYTSSGSTMQFYLKEKHVSSALALGTPNHFHKSTPLGGSVTHHRRVQTLTTGGLSSQHRWVRALTCWARELTPLPTPYFRLQNTLVIIFIILANATLTISARCTYSSSFRQKPQPPPVAGSEQSSWCLLQGRYGPSVYLSWKRARFIPFAADSILARGLGSCQCPVAGSGWWHMSRDFRRIQFCAAQNAGGAKESCQKLQVPAILFLPDDIMKMAQNCIIIFIPHLWN